MPSFTLCESCDGRGHDDDLLWPMPCDTCRGSGLEVWADEPWDLPDETEGYPTPRPETEA